MAIQEGHLDPQFALQEVDRLFDHHQEVQDHQAEVRDHHQEAQILAIQEEDKV